MIKIISEPTLRVSVTIVAWYILRIIKIDTLLTVFARLQAAYTGLLIARLLELEIETRTSRG